MRARTGRFMLVFGVVVGMVLGGGAAFASHQFSDVPNSNPFHKDIDFIADRSITLGCGGGLYCPKDFVTREEMAAFMERTVRVATPIVLAENEPLGNNLNATRCITDPHTPAYQQQVVVNAGLYAPGDDDAQGDRVTGMLRYRVNGGAWIDLNDDVMSDGNSPTDMADMAASLLGTLWLAPGSTYEFAVSVINRGDIGQCQLTAVIYNRMPTTIGLP